MSVDHIKNRCRMLESLTQELVGPDPQGRELDCSTPPRFEEWKDASGPWKEKETGQEILTQDRPCKRYGVGVLYPLQVQIADPRDPEDQQEPDEELADAPWEENPEGEKLLESSAKKDLEKFEEKSGGGLEIEDDYRELMGANQYLPSAMGVSFLAECPRNGKLEVLFQGGRYIPFQVTVGEYTPQWWRRREVSIQGTLDGQRLDDLKAVRKLPLETQVMGLEGVEGTEALCLGLDALVRPWQRKDEEEPAYLITLSVVNRSHSPTGVPDAFCLFQCQMSAEIQVQGKVKPCILPYPRPPEERLDDEEQEIELLYRDMSTYAVGHGCAADWIDPGTDRRSAGVRTRVLPTFETPGITPDIFVKGESGEYKKLSVRMAVLAGLSQEDEPLQELKQVVQAYQVWIKEREEEIPSLAPRYHPAAGRHVNTCKEALQRMEGGIQFLEKSARGDGLAWRAFQLANYAMLVQQLRTMEKAPRTWEFDSSKKRWFLQEPYPESVESQIQEVLQGKIPRGKWRPFQIAFLLMSLKSMAEGSDPMRDHVELIWFPTGGGKTEAYLGLAAFAMFLRRLRGVAEEKANEDAGVEVLMRYTLRLLTAQQFQRAAALLAAMEYLRREYEDELGRWPYLLGMWVGGTPNQRQQAVVARKELLKGYRAKHNIIVLERCPWCRAEMGQKRNPTKKKKNEQYELKGYVERPLEGSSSKTIVPICPDRKCLFHTTGLPVRFIDEDMYDVAVAPVSMIIGTVDKFAMLAWRPEARRLFGRGESGAASVSPPGLILQDELHLISGPLGSMVGLYETVIEYLCVKYLEDGSAQRPKIVASTATIRSFREQVQRLFGRKSTSLFPPPGIDAGDSFFAQYARDPKTNKYLPGRIYVGVYAPGLGSGQTTQVRTFSSLLQGVKIFPEGETRDPWWTLLVFYNSLRELGGGLTLFHSDIPDYLVGGIRSRKGLNWSEMRRLGRVKELTGRLDNREVVQVISDLEIATHADGAFPVDVCLASNIIEVGVDIDRLSLMVVVGQPKSTAQYIQVTGRVGRRWQERPGLVVTIYGASKPRDRSHYERFRSFHQQLYAQVEPSSVTPFSTPALERALHGVMVSFVRQTGPSETAGIARRPQPYPQSLVQEFSELVLERLEIVEDGERAALEKILRNRLMEWQRWQSVRWDGSSGSDIPLLRWPGRYADATTRSFSWLTPTSMRNVDEECRVSITRAYTQEDVQNDTNTLEE